LRDGAGEILGPWDATARPGQGGEPNAYWDIVPDIALPAGSYMVRDSSAATWAQNAGSGGAGMTTLEGTPE
jgi:hypothetical protein